MNTSNVGTYLIKAMYDYTSQFWHWNYFFNVTASDSGCLTQAIIFATKNSQNMTDETRQYAFYGTATSSVFSGLNTNSYEPFVEYCIVQSGHTPAPTDYPSLAPTPFPTAKPTTPSPTTSEPTTTTITTLAPTAAPTFNHSNQPQSFDCKFENHGAAIVVTFDQKTNRARLGGEPFNCQKIFAPKTFDQLQG